MTICSGNTGVMRGIDRALAPSAQSGMHRDLARGMVNPHFAVRYCHTDTFADQPPWHGVGVAVDLDHAVGSDTPDQFARAAERGDPGERLQCLSFCTRKASDRRLTSRAMITQLGNIA